MSVRGRFCVASLIEGRLSLLQWLLVLQGSASELTFGVEYIMYMLFELYFKSEFCHPKTWLAFWALSILQGRVVDGRLESWADFRPRFIAGLRKVASENF